MNPTFFRTPGEFKAWLSQNYSTADSLIVGFYKKGSGHPSITWPESVDEALCFGWIDGVRRGIDAERYSVRFTPRKSGSVWSNVNIGRFQVLLNEGRMQSAGIAAFEMRKEDRSGIYSHEQQSIELPAPYLKMLQENKAAWEFFQKQPPSYHKAVIWWVVSAKQEKTRLSRIEKLILHSAKAERLPQFTWKKASS